MYENDVDAAEFVTFEDVTVTTRAGNTMTKRVKVALDQQESQSGQIPIVGSSHPTPADCFEDGIAEADQVPMVPSKPRKVRSMNRADGRR